MVFKRLITKTHRQRLVAAQSFKVLDMPFFFFLILLLLCTAAAAMSDSVIDCDAEHAADGSTRKSRFSGDLANLAKQLSALQTAKNNTTLINYIEECNDPQKAKLIRNQPGGIEENIDFLRLVAGLNLGHLQIEAILDQTAGESKLKFKGKDERKEWIDIHRKRWMNMVRCVQQAVNRSPQPKWVAKTLPWLYTDGVASDQVVADDEEPEAKEHAEQDLTKGLEA